MVKRKNPYPYGKPYPKDLIAYIEECLRLQQELTAGAR